MRWHIIVHTTVLELFTRRDKPQDMDEDEKEIWEAKKNVNARKVKGVVQYQLW